MADDAPTPDRSKDEPRTFFEALFGAGIKDDGFVRTFLRLPATVRIAGSAALLAGLLFLPWLGAVGLWDPWETHYGEVAREMIHRGDWVYPFWENAWFFSKPAMTLWMMAAGMSLVGTNDPSVGASLATPGAVIVALLFALALAGSAWAVWRLRRLGERGVMWGAAGLSGVILLFGGWGLWRLLSGSAGVGPEGWTRDGALALYTEWGFRLPFALLSITAVTLLTLAVARVVSTRAGLATGFVLMTMPMYFLLTRQAVTDTPFVTSFVAAMACALIGQLDKGTNRRAAWWYAFYVFCGVATLAKGLLGIGFPAVILLLYAGLSVIPWSKEAWKRHWDWAAMYALVPLAQGLLAAALVAVPAYLAMKAGWSGLGSERDQLLVRKVFAGLAGFAVGAFVAGIQLGRRAPERGEVPTLWAQLFKMRLGTGIGVFFAVALPWYLTMSLFEGVDDESKSFWLRFWVHDHFNRLAAGVHTTTPGGSFTYFIEQGGYAIFPWVVGVPGALAIIARLKLRGGTAADHVGLIAAIWVAFTFGLLGMSETKFHHYVFPILPGLAILIGLFIDRVWEEGIPRHAVAGLFGLVLTMLVGKDLASNPKHWTDLFVYNYDRPYPHMLVTDTLSIGGRAVGWGDLVAVVLIALGAYLTWDAFADKARPILTRAAGMGMVLCGGAILAAVSFRGQVSVSLLLGLGAAAIAGYLAWEARRTPSPSAFAPAGAVGLVAAFLLYRGFQVAARQDDLFVRLIQAVNLEVALGFSFGVAILLLAVAAALRSRTMAFGTMGAFALGFALWFNWGHWVELSHHWTQRDLFWKYYELRQPEEPITAFLMNWRGETFYSKNEVKQIKENGRMTAYAAQPGREWALVEHNRLGILKSAVGPGHTVSVITDAKLNNKFVLVAID